MPCDSDYLCWPSSWETSLWLFQGSFLEMLLWRKVGVQNFYFLINVNLIGEINNWPWPNYLWTVSRGLTSKDHCNTWAWCLATFGTNSLFIITSGAYYFHILFAFVLPCSWDSCIQIYHVGTCTVPCLWI